MCFSGSWDPGPCVTPRIILLTVSFEPESFLLYWCLSWLSPSAAGWRKLCEVLEEVTLMAWFTTAKKFAFSKNLFVVCYHNERENGIVQENLYFDLKAHFDVTHTSPPPH